MSRGGSTESLTEPQRECLRLVLSHHNSKEIAAKLGISASAVDKRIERAVQLLGARSRFDAARRVAAEEGDGAWDRLPCDPIDVPDASSSVQARTRDGPRGLVSRLLGPGSPEAATHPARNPLTTSQRLLAVLGLVVAIAIASLVLVNVAVTLGELVGHARRP